VDQAAPADQHSWAQRERGENAGVVRRRQYVLIAMVKKSFNSMLALQLLQILSVSIFEKMSLQQALTEMTLPQTTSSIQQLNLLGF